MKVKPEGLRGAANIYSRGGRHPLTAMFGADETSFGGGYAVYCLFENKEKHDIDILKAEFDAGSDLHYPALTPVLPAAAWYERELHDMFGFIPMIIRICGRWFCMKLILKIFIRCANVLILMLMCVESESMNGLFARRWAVRSTCRSYSCRYH